MKKSLLYSLTLIFILMLALTACNNRLASLWNDSSDYIIYTPSPSAQTQAATSSALATDTTENLAESMATSEEITVIHTPETHILHGDSQDDNHATTNQVETRLEETTPIERQTEIGESTAIETEIVEITPSRPSITTPQNIPHTLFKPNGNHINLVTYNDNTISFFIVGNDPKIKASLGDLAFPSSQYGALQFSLKTASDCSGKLYFATSQSHLCDSQMVTFSIVGDDQWHTHIIDLSSLSSYTDNIIILRIDIENAVMGQKIELKDIYAINI